MQFRSRYKAALMFMGFSVMPNLAYAYSHQYIHQTRSSTESHVLISQSLDGEYGSYQKSDSVPGNSDQGVRENWQGYGVKTGASIELMKFIQFGISHNLSQMKKSNGAAARLSGSKLAGEVKFVFAAPLANLEASGGVLGSRLDYQNTEEFASYYGSGSFYSLGLNHFMSSKVSVFANAKLAQENLVKNTGSEDLPSYKTETTSVGIGFIIWL